MRSPVSAVMSEPPLTYRIVTMRSYQAVLLLLAALAVFAFYYLGSGKENFSSTTRRMKEHSAIPDMELLPPSSSELKLGEGKSKNLESRGVQDYHVLMMFTKVDRAPGLRSKFQVALRSLVKYGKFESTEVLSLHFVADESSKEIGKTMLRDLLQGASFKYKVIFHDVSSLTEKLVPIVEAMQKLFSAGTGTYYSDSIFFLSVALHQIMPKDISRIIQLDLDLKFQTNIRELFEEFDNFLQNSVIGIAHEMQPVYRHTFWQYRRENPNTKVGGPPPDGMPGFNSGVMLLNLEAMRQSKLYNQLLEPNAVRLLAEKYHFKGHLGDQDFFSMIGMEHPELFYVLDCGWNRQLCTWWKDQGYADIFDLYYKCESHIRIIHGNCNTPIPE
ncbi:xyloside xylosyltransferase 1 isoform X2 [Bufo gargarizans]|uniref:xyloside xylosyltransferase 1 isoform X2 n=1 Tax=Bufo gargarizans TaxID=30331 RepID=UPI001CF3D692|nr:xyloside xylosyltransferase 1 isoform X2 [Bufo gargarizans]